MIDELFLWIIMSKKFKFLNHHRRSRNVRDAAMILVLLAIVVEIVLIFVLP